MKLDDNLQKTYDQYYENDISEWRTLGAIDKVKNIIELAGYENNKIIEIGAGDGSILSMLSEKKFAKEYYAVEISESAIELLKKKKIESVIEITKFDGYKIPYPDKFFDLAILSHVLEHVEYPRLLLRELKRISKKQLIEVPRDYSYGVDKKFKQLISYGHINVYTPTLLRFLLNTESFKIIKDKMSFYSKEIIEYSWKANNKKSGLIFKIKLLMYLILRKLAFIIFPDSRKETMINTYTVLTE
ncbi:MAG: class I SAM-dependent methyltransferase [Bacteroidales bacterium]|nr:class I SAM-dependent methyltransferase [Bacteroidales bacterium]MBN2757761.1 class I SAM-dependent methyltransferase [Bacteroidales bacterium]